MKDNKYVLLNEVCEAIVDCEHKTAPIESVGIPSVRTANIKNGRIDFKSCNRVSESTYREWTKRLEPKPDDLILAREAPVGEVGIIPSDMKACLGQRTVLIRSDRKKIKPKYLLYLLLTQEMKHEMICKAEGSIVPHLNMSDIRTIEIPIRPLPEQKAIAHILGTLDDKIELNRKMNETLESIARAIFKSWFVDFDPVRAKLEGRQPAGMDAETAALFPDGFEGSELGKIPKGWKVGTLHDMIDIIGGGTPKTSIPEYWNGDIFWFSAGDAPSESDIFVIKTEKKITSLGVEKSSTKILPVGTTIITARGTVGKCALVGKPMAMNQTCYGLKSKNGNDFLIYFTTRYHVSELQRQGHGSIFNTIIRDTFKSISVPTSSPNHEKAFEHAVSPFLNKIMNNLEESNTLTTLRDTLLPKLISGKLRIPDAEKIVEDAA